MYYASVINFKHDQVLWDTQYAQYHVDKEGAECLESLYLLFMNKVFSICGTYVTLHDAFN